MKQSWLSCCGITRKQNQSTSVPIWDQTQVLHYKIDDDKIPLTLDLLNHLHHHLRQCWQTTYLTHHHLHPFSLADFLSSSDEILQAEPKQSGTKHYYAMLNTRSDMKYTNNCSLSKISMHVVVFQGPTLIIASLENTLLKQKSTAVAATETVAVFFPYICIAQLRTLQSETMSYKIGQPVHLSDHPSHAGISQKMMNVRERPMLILNIGRHPLTKSMNRCLRSADTDSKKKLRTALCRAESTCDC